MAGSRGTGWAATAAGLVGGLVWSLWVAFSMPSGRHGAVACGTPAPGSRATVERSWLPPSATCVHTAPGGAVERVPYIGTATTVLMTVVALLLLACLVAGLARVAHRLLLRPDPRTDRRPGRGPWRAAGHALGAAGLGATVAVLGGKTALLMTLRTHGAGLVFAVVAVGLVAIGAATVLDRLTGPGGTRLDARRRGTAVGTIGTAATFGLVYVTSTGLPMFDVGRWALVGAAVFAVLATLQRLGAATPPDPAHVAQR
jgi:hypothetical protein